MKDSFCSSPWFHLRISPDGYYRPCRWGDYSVGTEHHISNTSLTEYLNSDIMSELRTSLLNGEKPSLCNDCYYESAHGKVSGRQRQLLKSGIVESNFEKTFCSSPHWNNFQYSYANNGQTQTQPVDFQIDLGNTCNSACIMCPPRYSSRVTEDHKKLFKISPLFDDPVRITNWSDDPELVAKFVSEIAEIDNIKYLHFLGGETLYIRSFYDICDQLIERDIAPNVIMGTTTNCTVYDQRIERIIRSFKQVHLGLSVEAVTDLNDYIRWPGKITTVLANIEKFLSLRKETNLQISLRITPNIFSIWHLDQMIDFMVEHHVIAESCNILYYPASLRMELLPEDIRAKVLAKIDAAIAKHGLVRPGQVIINRRRDDIIDPVIATVVYEYRDFIASYKAPEDLEKQRKDLIEYLHAYESIHNNSIVDYLPEYEEFLRSYGY